MSGMQGCKTKNIVGRYVIILRDCECGNDELNGMFKFYVISKCFMVATCKKDYKSNAEVFHFEEDNFKSHIYGIYRRNLCNQKYHQVHQ